MEKLCLLPLRLRFDYQGYLIREVKLMQLQWKEVTPTYVDLYHNGLILDGEASCVNDVIEMWMRIGSHVNHEWDSFDFSRAHPFTYGTVLKFPAICAQFTDSAKN